MIKEGFQFTRLMMVLSSMAPLFLLWAVRGSKYAPGLNFILGCLCFATVPTLILLLRIRIAKCRNDCLTKVIYHADDHKDHILVYLFANLLPFFTTTLDNGREFSSTLLALCFILFLFWHLNMHYMNILFALKGYRVFTITPNPADTFGSKSSFVILTKRVVLLADEQIETYRLSDTVFIEK